MLGQVPIYRRKLSVAEVQARIERCYRPYHAALDAAIDAAYRTRADRDSRVILGTSLGGLFSAYLGTQQPAQTRPSGHPEDRAQQEQLQAKYMAILNTQLLKFYQGDQLAL